jgi:hypothetical protein
MNPVAIVGKHSLTCNLAPFENKNIDIWGFNNNAQGMKRITASFEMHNDFSERIGEKYVSWLKKKKTPTYMQIRSSNYPSSIEYPYDSVFALIKNVLQGEKELQPVHLLCSTLDHAIALAILQNRPKIYYYGIALLGDMAGEDYTEYFYQRNSFMFWTGVAAGKGIPLEIPCADNLFKRKIEIVGKDSEQIYLLTKHVLQGIKELQPLRLVTSKLDYNIAIAIAHGVPKISLSNINFGNKIGNSIFQESFMFWLGFAAGKGVILEIKCCDEIFKKPIYGKEDR